VVGRFLNEKNRTNKNVLHNAKGFIGLPADAPFSPVVGIDFALSGKGRITGGEENVSVFGFGFPGNNHGKRHQEQKGGVCSF
jgi:hypothetical protein